MTTKCEACGSTMDIAVDDQHTEFINIVLCNACVAKLKEEKKEE